MRRAFLVPIWLCLLAATGLAAKPSIVGTWKCDKRVYSQPGILFSMKVTLVFKADGTCSMVNEFPKSREDPHDPRRLEGLVQKSSGTYKLVGNTIAYRGLHGQAVQKIRINLSKDSLEITGDKIPRGFIFRRVHAAK